MTSNVRLPDVCEVEDGVLKSIDLSKLYFPDDEEPRQEIRLVRVAPKPTSLLAPPKITRRALVPMAELTLTRTSLPASRGTPRVSLRPFRKAESSPTIRPLPSATYSVGRQRDSSLLGSLLTGALGERERIKIELPFGLRRFVNAATLKAMLGADDGETLFKKVAYRWEVCADSLEVDLKDRRQVFRLGRVQIYS